MSKKVITPVGTSLFVNYMKEHDDITSDYKMIEESSASAWDKWDIERNAICHSVKSWATDMLKKSKLKVSAEIKSLVKVLEEQHESIEVYLLATDTILSRLAAEILQEVLNKYRNDEGNTIKVSFNTKLDVITGLQIQKKYDFKKFGISGLVQRIYSIVCGASNEVIFNITGGYKATIPYLTIMAQIHGFPLCYIFEDTEELIMIPQTPLDIKWEIFDTYWENFGLLHREGVMNAHKLSYQFKEECAGCLEVVDNMAALNPLGEMLWQRFCSRYFLFSCPNSVWNDIQNQPHIYDILKSKFFNEAMRENKTERKNGHVVYDDGDNPFRIYYFKDGEHIYIYKTFEDHQAAEDFIKTSYDQDVIKSSSILRKIEISMTTTN